MRANADYPYVWLQGHILVSFYVQLQKMGCAGNAGIVITDDGFTVQAQCIVVLFQSK
jgi:hypothetical protein